MNNARAHNFSILDWTTKAGDQNKIPCKPNDVTVQFCLDNNEYFATQPEDGVECCYMEDDAESDNLDVYLKTGKRESQLRQNLVVFCTSIYFRSALALLGLAVVAFSVHKVTVALKAIEGDIQFSTEFPISNFTTVTPPPGITCRIDSSRDLRILQRCEALLVLSLEKNWRKANFPKNEFQHVKLVEFHGEIPEKDVKYILESATNVETVVLNVNSLCIGGTVEQRDTLEVVELPQAQRLEVQDATYCPLDNWFYRWKTPKLHTLLLKNVNITKEKYSPLQDFLRKNQEHLKEIYMRNCTFCPLCQIPKDLPIFF